MIRRSLYCAFAAALILVGWTAAAPRRAAGQVIPFDDVQLFMELNSTDGDAGVQLFIDADEWQHLKMFNPSGQKILDIRVQKGLAELGLTELFFESGEPSPEEVFAIFEEGDYLLQASTADGDLFTGTATLSHMFLDPPDVTPVDGEIVDADNTVVSFDPVAGAVAYEVIIENEDIHGEMTVRLPASKTSLQLPPGFLDPDTEYDLEVLAIAASGNKTISESSFVTMP